MKDNHEFAHLDELRDRMHQLALATVDAVNNPEQDAAAVRLAAEAHIARDEYLREAKRLFGG